MSIFKVLNFIYFHPFNSENKIGGIIRFAKWQINCLLNPYPIIYTLTENSKLVISKGLTGATGNIYCGLMEYQDMGFLLNFLNHEDLFIDIGANVGVYTVLASGEIGASTISIEPIPETYSKLVQNIMLNQIQNKVKALNIGLGSAHGNLNFTKSQDTVNHVATNEDKDTIEVKILPLDSVINDVIPIMLKIDVEGFEMEVLKGAKNLLGNKKLKVIIIELNGSGLRYGFNENDIHKVLLGTGFTPYAYDPKQRKLIQLESYSNHNTIYLRDLPFVENRIGQSSKVRIGSTNVYI